MSNVQNKLDEILLSVEKPGRYIGEEFNSIVKDEKDEDARKIEKNMKDLLELVHSYDVIKKIEG